MKLEFKEEQKFTQWWVWIILLSLLSIPFYNFFYEGLSGLLKSVPIILAVALFYFLKLKTKIDENNITINYTLFNNKTVNWTQIKTVKLIDYGFVGGWGVRFWTKYGTVYNIRGCKGLLVGLNNGKTFVVGTQKEKELKEFLKQIGKYKSE